MPTIEDWVAATGPRAVSDDAEDTSIPLTVLDNPNLSLIAKGVFAWMLSYQGQPVNPYDDAIEEVEAIRDAIDELIAARIVIRVPP